MVTVKILCHLREALPRLPHPEKLYPNPKRLYDSFHAVWIVFRERKGKGVAVLTLGNLNYYLKGGKRKIVKEEKFCDFHLNLWM